MTQVEVWNPEAWKVGFKDAPRRELSRNSLDHVRGEMDTELTLLARFSQANDSAQAFDITQALSSEVPSPSPALPQSWDHLNASYWLRASQPRDKTFDYNEARRIAAATIRAAEFEASRGFPRKAAY